MKFLVFLCCAIVFVESLPLEEIEDFEGHDVAVEIQTNESEHDPLVRIKRQFNPYQRSSFPSQGLPAPTFYVPPPRNTPLRPNPWSGNFIGNPPAVGGRLNYDVPRGGASVIGTHTFGSNPNTRVGVEGRLNLRDNKDQKLILDGTFSTNIGPKPRNPEIGLGLTYQRG